MAATINDIRDLVAARIPALTLPVTPAVTVKFGKKITPQDVAGEALVTVGGAAQQFERTSRADGRQQPVIAVGVHRKIGTNSDGEPDQTIADQMIELTEALAKQLLQPFPGAENATPVTAEIPILYRPQELEEKGMFQSVVLLTFSSEFEIGT